MITVSDYNLLKEGNVYNNTSVATYSVTASGINFLYGDDTSVAAFSIPSGSVASVIVEFGEYYSVGNFKLHVDPVAVEDITATYGLEAIDTNLVSVVSSGTYAFGVIEDEVGFLSITVSGSTSTTVYELFVEGELSDFIGFGTSSSGLTDSINLGGVPTAYYRPDPVKVDVYNEYPHESDIMVSVAPTASGSDNYVYLSTTQDGTYYGINGNGIKQPSFVEISDVDESLDLDSIGDLLNRWDYVVSSSSFLSSNSGYVRLFSSNNYVSIYRTTAPYNGYTDAMLVSKNEFTANQSFTISLDVRIVDATLDNTLAAPASVTPNKFLFGFTDSYPIREHYTNTPTPDRTGKSLAAVWIGTHTPLGDATDLAVGTAANDFDFSDFEATTNFSAARTNSNSHPIVSAISLEYLSNYVFGEEVYLDGGTTALWRTLKLSYDHRTRTVYYFFNNISLGHVQFSSSAFFEACKFFFGFNGVGQFAIDMRNFSIEKNVVYKVSHNQLLAVSSSNKGPLHLPGNMINGVYNSDYFTSSWLSDDDPEAGDYFNITFGDVVDVDAVRVRKPTSIQSVSVSGTVLSPVRYSLDSTLLYFDTGDVRYIDFSLATPTGMDGWDVSYLTTTSGTIEPVTGVTSVSGIIITLNDSGEDITRIPVLAVDEIQFYTISETAATTDSTYVSGTFPWSKGYAENIKHFGSSSSYELDNAAKYDMAGSLDVSKLVRYSDYNVSSPVRGSVVYSDESFLHHFFESSLVIYNRDSTYTEGNIENGATGWFWRFFDYTVDLRGVYLLLFAGTESMLADVDKWKVQYLIEGGNPNSSADWADIPPITSSYSGGGDYTTYTDYLIANNDGEYYTSYMNSLDFVAVGSVLSLPDTLLCQKNSYGKPGHLAKSQNLASAGVYIEFDQSYRTQGLRFVIADGYEDMSRVVKASGYTVSMFMCYAEKASGFYLSPVFDTGTKQNTERVFIDVDNYGGGSSAFYRSSPTPPSYKHDSAYERWEVVCSPFGGMENVPDWSPFFNGADIVAVGDTFYFMGQNTDRTITYNSSSGRWAWGASYPSETTGEDIKPDLLTSNNSVVIDGKIVVACTSDGGGGTRTSGLMQYHLSANEYNYTGWEMFPYQRQVEAVYASMVSDGANRIFFFGRDGTVTVFYMSNGALTTEDRVAMPLYGYARREYFVPAYVDDKIYIFGGYGGSGPGSGPGDSLDIYDVAADSWSVGAVAPYKVEMASALHYDGDIYILPSHSTYGAGSSIFMKYNIVLDSWTVLSHLSYNHRSSYLSVGTGGGFTGNNPQLHRYFISGGYIYGFNYLHSELDFRRFKVSKDPWETGNLPLVDEVSWINNGGETWDKVTSVSGELMPQSRYMQYKVILESNGSEATPIINGTSLVQPLRLPNIPSSGTDSFYVKSGVSVEDAYEAWYTGFADLNFANDYYSSIMYTRSPNGQEFNKSISSLYGVTVSGGSGNVVMYYDACVVKDSGEYEMWATHARLADSNSFDIMWGNIHKVTISGGYQTTSPQHSLARGTEGTYDTYSIYSPSVIKSGTEYKMWYTGVDSSSVHRILYADSVDGLTWTNFTLSQDIGTLSLEPDADENSSNSPSVVKVGSTYYMWYEGKDSSSESRIIYCSSTDGNNWQGHSIVISKGDIDRVDTVGCGRPSVVFDIDTYKMWFVVYGSDEDLIYYAQSSDGTVWSGFKSVLARKHEGTYDYSLISSINVIVDRNILDVPTIHKAKIKIYND